MLDRIVMGQRIEITGSYSIERRFSHSDRVQLRDPAHGPRDHSATIFVTVSTSRFLYFSRSSSRVTSAFRDMNELTRVWAPVAAHVKIAETVLRGREWIPRVRAKYFLAWDFRGL